MSISIHIPTPLRPYTSGRSTVEVTGDTVGIALNDLTTSHPDLAELARHLSQRGAEFADLIAEARLVGFEQRRSLAHPA